MSRIEHEAAQLDSVIDDLIHGPAGPVRLDDEGLVATAHLLHEALPRLHPRFSFEEHLAARLARAGRPQPAGPGGAVAASIAPMTVPSPDVVPGASDRRRRSLVAGGAIASGVSLAIPIAGAAWVAWRRSRSSGGIF
jgi:hypothetical protein